MLKLIALGFLGIQQYSRFVRTESYRQQIVEKINNNCYDKKKLEPVSGKPENRPQFYLSVVCCLLLIRGFILLSLMSCDHRHI